MKDITVFAIRKAIPTLFLLSSLFSSCENPGEIELKSGKISFPASGAVYYEDRDIIFMASIGGEWSSQIDGIIGKGKQVRTKLSPGIHHITLNSPGYRIKPIDVNVLPFEGDVLLFKLQGNNPVIMVPEGVWSAGAFSLQKEKAPMASVERTSEKREKTTGIALYPPVTGVYPDRINDNVLFSKSANLCDSIREYLIVDLEQGNSSEGTAISTRCCYQGRKCDVWLDLDAPSVEHFQGMMVKIDQALNEHYEIWGDWYDLDGNGKCNIVMTKLVNESGIAIGYFNPADFYKRNGDSNSPSYNPNSNEQDVLYIGVPDADSPSFSLSSVIATVIHETTHLKIFSRYYQERRNNPNSRIEREAVFLDEGLAHFSESLGGYGLSGGNKAFIAKYLDRMFDVSLSGIDVDFQGDTVERRGGMALLLNWLFWYMGGCECNGDGSFIDLGGIGWLEDLMASNEKGWARLCESTGMNKQDIFQSFLEALLDENSWRSFQHPITGENRVDDPYSGEIIELSQTYVLDGPKRYEKGETILYPYSIVIYENENFTSDTQMIFSGEYSDVFIFFKRVYKNSLSFEH